MIHSRRQIDMGEYFQSRASKSWDEVHDEHNGGPPENPLLLFCDLILKYEKYKQTELPTHTAFHGALTASELSWWPQTDVLFSPPIQMDMDQDYASSGSEKTNDSFSSEADMNFNNNSYSSSDMKMNVESDADSWDLITCFCMKPFKGRPMIECTGCGTWLHMSCVKVRPNNVPDVFLCQFCQETNSRKRRSERIRSDDRRLSP